MEKLVILDYESGYVHLFDIDPNANIDEDYIRALGFNPDSCSWMFGDNIEVYIHKGILK